MEVVVLVAAAAAAAAIVVVVVGRQKNQALRGRLALSRPRPGKKAWGRIRSPPQRGPIHKRFAGTPAWAAGERLAGKCSKVFFFPPLLQHHHRQPPTITRGQAAPSPPS